MRMATAWLLLAAVLCGSAAAGMATRRLKPQQSPPNTFRFDVPANAKVYRADLLISRAAEVAGKDDDALASVEIVPLFGAQEQGKPLELRAPWYDRLDATEAVRAWASGKPNNGFLVKACPPYDPKTVWLELTIEGREAGGTPAGH